MTSKKGDRRLRFAKEGRPLSAGKLDRGPGKRKKLRLYIPRREILSSGGSENTDPPTIGDSLGKTFKRAGEGQPEPKA